MTGRALKMLALAVKFIDMLYTIFVFSFDIRILTAANGIYSRDRSHGVIGVHKTADATCYEASV